jgi:hypothetical protein
MRKQVAITLVRISLLVVATIVVAGASAKGQSLQGTLRVNIPFDFTVANKKLPAGEYLIQRAQQTTGDTMIQISSRDARSNIFRATIPVTIEAPMEKGTLLFHRYGENEYFLFQIWPAAATTGRSLIRSRSERAAEQKLHDYSTPGTARLKPTTVTLVAEQL